jgi:AraC-like DNA-binding protein
MGRIGRSLDPATVSALAAILGSFAGAFASTLSAWITQRHHDRKDLLAKKIAHREQLYSDFISESARAMVDAMQHKFEDPSKLTPIYALISRIRLGSPTNVVESAERVAKTILITYSKPNLTAEEIQSGVSIRDDPLREFSIICRHELESLRGSL